MGKTVILLCVLSLQLGYGQYYNFKAMQGTYDTIVNGQELIQSSPGYYSYQVSKPFSLFGEALNTQFVIGDDGFIVLSNNTRAVAFDVANASMTPHTMNSGVFVKETTIQGEPVLQVEWRNMKFDQHPPTDVANFKAHIYLETEVLEFYYGDILVTDTTALHGRKAPLVFHGLFSQDFQTIYETYIPIGPPANPTAVPNHRGGQLDTVPQNGQIYRFEPFNISLTESQDNEVSLYPNPGDDLLKLKISSPGPFRYQVIALTGEIVDTGQFNGSEIDISNLKKGQYIIRVTRRGEDILKTVFQKK